MNLVLAGCHAEYMVERQEGLPANVQEIGLLDSSKARSQYPKVEVELRDNVT